MSSSAIVEGCEAEVKGGKLRRIDSVELPKELLLELRLLKLPPPFANTDC
jgi:hypothetical protein